MSRTSKRRRQNRKKGTPSIQQPPTPNAVSAQQHYQQALKAQQQGDIEQSLALLQKAVELNPAEISYYAEIAELLVKVGMEKEAIQIYRESLKIAPNHPALLNNIANVLKRSGVLEEAIHYYRQAVMAAPDNTTLKWNLALSLIMDGQLKEGWDYYEFGLDDDNLRPAKHFPLPPWSGEPLSGKKILVFSEQGVGDEIMFSSCIPDLLTHSPAQCIVECDPRLAPLFARSFPGAIFCGEKQGPDEMWIEPYQPIDHQVAIGSLPHHFRNHTDNFPERDHYLIPDPALLELWRERFSQLGEGLYVGISWRGGKSPEQQQLRSHALHAWLPILRLQGIHIINLQYGDCAQEITELHQQSGVTVHDWEDADPLRNLEMQAAQIAALDLVISIDNSTVHMAGAVGTTTWAILPQAANWRWMQPATETPWYRTLTLYQQQDGEDGSDIINRIANDLFQHTKPQPTHHVEPSTMTKPELSPKGQELISLYTQMAEHGYERRDESYVEDAFSDFELRFYRPQIREIFNEFEIQSVLDYGCGGSNWNTPNFDATGESAIEYFKLERAHHYEPSRDRDERTRVDCVISFDVLEHIFISDVPAILRDMFSYADKLLVLNVACYPAAAKLPNGENAHITVRDPSWWKGMVDSIAVEFPNISVWLICSPGYRQSSAFPIWSGDGWQQSETFVVDN